MRALDPGAAPALRRLDLSAQHGPGGRTHTTGAPGAVEAVLASLKGSVTKAPRGAELQELDLSGLAVSEQGEGWMKRHGEGCIRGRVWGAHRWCMGRCLMCQ